MVDTTSFGSTTPDGTLTASFRQKAAFMKTWKPASSPSNRDRLELYALHKQAVSGDAPPTVGSVPASPAEKAKYTAWRSKSGMSVDEAMRLYMQEADRQVRVYGLAVVVPAAAAATTATSENALATAQQQQQMTPQNTPVDGNSQASYSSTGGGTRGAAGSGSQQAPPPSLQCRGLAAIPLLCAAASESRPAYLRRLANTADPSLGWWKRQEALTATPGSLWAFPESVLLWIAALVEHISLSIQQQHFQNSQQQQQQDQSIDEVDSGNNNKGPISMIVGLIPPALVQSFLWPVHNVLLALWMGYILHIVAWQSAYQVISTALLGSRRTGHSLAAVWNDQVHWSAVSVSTLTESHQPLTARLVGLVLLPYTWMVTLIHNMLLLSSSSSSSSSSLGDNSAGAAGGGGGGANNPAATSANRSTSGNRSAANSNSGPSGASLLVASGLYVMGLSVTWWYWWLVLPWLAFWFLAGAFVSGNCFALIEMAG